jgi:hypothetical protein
LKTGAEDPRKKIAAGVLGALALGLVAYNLSDLFGGSAPKPVAPVVVTTTSLAKPAAGGRAAVKIGTTSAQLDPTLHMEAMLVTESLVYSGLGRNIFAPGNVVTVAAPKPVAPARPLVAVATGPPPPPPTCPPSCPPPPPINLKFFGTATAANGTRRAFLLNGDDVFVASAGDVVERKYRVVSIAVNSILVEDIPNANKQTLPLLGN